MTTNDRKIATSIGEKLRVNAAVCKLISDLATDLAKRELFDRFAVT